MKSFFQHPVVVLGLACMACGLVGIGCAESGSSSVDRPKAVDLYVTAVEAYHAGDYAKAKDRLEVATRINPDLRMAHSLLGDLYRAEGRYDEAREQYRAMTELDPYTASNHYRLGLTYQFLQRFKEAAACYLRALELHPSDWKSNMNLGLTFLALEQYDDAFKYADMAARIAPKESQTWSNLGVVLDARGQFSEAESAYRKSLELGGNNVTTMMNLTSNLLNQNKPTEASAVMEQAIQQERNPVTLKRHGDTLLASRKYEQAIEQFDEALKLDPNYLPAINERGVAYIRIYDERELGLNDVPRMKALESWRQSLAIKSDQPRVQQWIRKWTEQRLFDK